MARHSSPPQRTDGFPSSAPRSLVGHLAQLPECGCADADREPKASGWARLLIICGGSAALWALLIVGVWALVLR